MTQIVGAEARQARLLGQLVHHMLQVVEREGFAFVGSEHEGTTTPALASQQAPLHLLHTQLPQQEHCGGRQRHGALAVGFEGSQLLVRGQLVSDGQPALLEVQIFPAQGQQLGRPQPWGHGRLDQGSPANILSARQQGLDLLERESPQLELVS